MCLYSVSIYIFHVLYIIPVIYSASSVDVHQCLSVRQCLCCLYSVLLYVLLSKSSNEETVLVVNDLKSNVDESSIRSLFSQYLYIHTMLLAFVICGVILHIK